MANSVDPDQTLHSAASDLGIHCVLRPVCPTIKYYRKKINYQAQWLLNKMKQVL